jgi:hypothetical protein
MNDDNPITIARNLVNDARFPNSYYCVGRAHSDLEAADLALFRLDIRQVFEDQALWFAVRCEIKALRDRCCSVTKRAICYDRDRDYNVRTLCRERLWIACNQRPGNDITAPPYCVR